MKKLIHLFFIPNIVFFIFLGANLVFFMEPDEALGFDCQDKSGAFFKVRPIKQSDQQRIQELEEAHDRDCFSG